MMVVAALSLVIVSHRSLPSLPPFVDRRVFPARLGAETPGRRFRPS
jgi:hypothetical protein